MTWKIKIKACLLLALSAAIFSCKKDTSSTPPAELSNPNTATLGDFFTANAGSPQTMTLSASVGYSITGIHGTQILVPANAFMTGFGALVTGTVAFSFTELYSKKDFILNKAQTMTASDMLVSGGALNVIVSQNGQTLKLYPGKKLAIKMPAGVAPSYSMQVFYGATDFTSNDLLWTQALSPIAAPPVPDTANVINPYYYSFTSDSLNWINCDYFYSNQNPKTTVTITVHGNYNGSNTRVYLVYNNLKAVSMLYASGTTQSFSQSYTIPVGLNATIIAIARINGNFYASYTNTTIAANHLQDINLSPTTDSEILSKLSTY
jgi:hypothetical protein